MGGESESNLPAVIAALHVVRVRSPVFYGFLFSTAAQLVDHPRHARQAQQCRRQAKRSLGIRLVALSPSVPPAHTRRRRSMMIACQQKKQNSLEAANRKPRQQASPSASHQPRLDTVLPLVA